MQKADKVPGFLVKAVPARPLRSLGKALAVLRAFVVQNVMLARHIEDGLRLGRFQDLLHVIELFGLGEMTDVAGVQHELRRSPQRIALIYACFHSPTYLSIPRF